MMEELVRNVAAQVGTDEETARSAIGTLLAFVHENADREKVDRLFEQLPEAQTLADDIMASGHDVHGGLLNRLGGMLGGSVGSAMQTMSRLQELGLSTQQIGDVGKMTFRYCRDNVQDKELFWDVIRSLQGRVPMLDRFLPTRRS